MNSGSDEGLEKDVALQLDEVEVEELRGEAELPTREMWLKETKTVANLTWPPVLTYIGTMMVNVISLQFAGHLGKEELASAALAQTFSNVTFFALVAGMASGVDTLCSQAYGAGNYERLGVFLQQAFVIVGALGLGVLGLWIFTEDVLIFARQDPKLAAMALKWVLGLAPGIPGFITFELVKRFMQAMQVVRPAFYLSLCGVCVHLVVTWIFVGSIGFVGAPLATSVTQTFLGISLVVVYWLKYSVNEDGVRPWRGFSRDGVSLSGLKSYLSLAIPGTVMICVEWYAFEMTIIAAGILGTVELGTHSVVLTSGAVFYMIPLGISVAASARVGSHLGAGNARLARIAAAVCVIISATAMITISIGVVIFRKWFGYLFTNESDVIAMVAKVVPVLVLFEMWDGNTGTCMGITKGLGKQKLGAVLVTAAYYIVGLPIAYVLAFQADMGVRGIWVGLTAGVATVSVLFLIYLFVLLDWNKAVQAAQDRVQIARSDDEGIEDEAPPNKTQGQSKKGYVVVDRKSSVDAGREPDQMGV